MNNLKPCPFCGNEVRFEVKSYEYGKDYHEHCFVIRCDSCDFEFPRNQFKITANWDDDKGEYVNDMTEFNKAVEVWNSRVAMNKGEQHDQ